MFNVLFLCTGNSARSIIAEALMNNLAIGQGRFKAFSAGSHPAGQVHPLALEVLAANRLPVEGYRSKNWDEFAAPGAPPLHFVFTVCDRAAAEMCPVWPGQPMTAHWGVTDPAAAQGTHDERLRVFRDVLIHLRRRIELFASLPLDTVSGLALQQRLDHIGRS